MGTMRVERATTTATATTMVTITRTGAGDTNRRIYGVHCPCFYLASSSTPPHYK